MQQQQDGELPAEAEVATEAEEPPRATGKFGFPELPTVFPPRRPKNYKLEKGQVGRRNILSVTRRVICPILVSNLQPCRFLG